MNSLAKPLRPWLIRKRSDDSGWTIWKWSTLKCQYVSIVDVPTGARALELYVASAP